MLEEISYLPIKMAVGVFKIPDNYEVIGTHAVRDTKSGGSGVLVQNKHTGIYGIFSVGALLSVNPKDARDLICKWTPQT